MAGVTGFLKKAFPFISAAASVGGPLGTLAAAAVGKALGVDKVEPTENAITTAIAGATPEQMIALKQAEMDCQAKLQQMGFQNAEDLESIAEQDRANARAREIALKDRVPALLALAITVGFFGILLLVVLRGINSNVHDLVTLLLGSLGTAWTGMVTYYFGSSSGSARKTEILANGNGQPH